MRLTTQELVKCLQRAAEDTTRLCPQHKQQTLYWLAAEAILSLGGRDVELSYSPFTAYDPHAHQSSTS